MDKRTQTNKPEDKKVNKDGQGLMSEGRHRLYLSRRKRKKACQYKYKGSKIMLTSEKKD